MGDYIELSFNIFDQVGQRARVRRTLTISELINEILNEFDETKSSDMDMYALYLNKSPVPLPRTSTLDLLDVQPNDELEFKHLGGSSRIPIPSRKYAHLIDLSTDKIYEVRWHPAIIGRPDIDPEHNELLAVNLASHQFGKRVSRRHAQIVFEGGLFLIESQSNHNPTFINDDPHPLNTKRALVSGDRIHLGRSQITLAFMVVDRQEAQNGL